MNAKTLHLVCPKSNATNRVPSDKLQAELNGGFKTVAALTAQLCYLI
jgi:hypothetical protein